MRRLLLLPLFAIMACSSVAAAAAEVTLRRTVLALYDSRWEKDVVDTRIHRFVEAPLNHLGLSIRYHDIAQGLPASGTMDDVRGVVSWFSNIVEENAQDYVRWAAATIGEGRYFAVLGDPGFRTHTLTGPDVALAEQFTSALGVVPTGRYRPGPYNITILNKVPEMVEYERRLMGPLPGFLEFRQSGGGSTSFLHVRLGDDPETDSHLVVTGERGGMVAWGYEIYTDPRLGYTQWRLNPFAFFRRAFNTDELPKPDPTTVGGRRVFYALVEGDGWLDVTRLPRYNKRSTLCAEVVLDAILRRYTDLAFTVAPIVADLDYGWHGTEKAREVAERIASLPNVEVASHTLSHPFIWNRFAKGSEETPDETGSTSEGGLLAGQDTEPTVFWSDRARQLRLVGENIPPPYRAYTDQPFDLAAEIPGSVAFLNELLAGRKRVTLLTWAGDTRPYESALAAARAAGVSNINGGSSGYDQEYPSITSTSPIGLRVGEHYQVYGGNRYESSYSNRLGDIVPGQYHLTRVLELTEMPRRLRPADAYWHMYAAQETKSLNGVLAQLDLAQRLELAPVTAAAYARMAGGFNSAVLVKTGDNAWRIENRSDLATIRFDDALFVAVDFERSRGVIGQRQYQGSLYVHLDSAEPAPIIALTGSDSGSSPPEAPRPYLVHSRWVIGNLMMDKQGFEFASTGFGAGDMVWQVPVAGTYEIEVQFADGADWRGTAMATSDRLIRFVPPDSRAQQARIRVNMPQGQT